MCFLCSATQAFDPQRHGADEASDTSHSGASNTSELHTSSGVGNLDDLAHFLTDGYWEAGGKRGRSFNSSDITVNLDGLTAEGKQLARWAFEAWEQVADLQFIETKSSSANILFDDNQSGAFASLTTSGESLLSARINVSTDWVDHYGININNYAFQTYVHEIGHALGLGHQGVYNGSATYGEHQGFDNDSWQVSVMSYFDQIENTATLASYAALVSTMMADIVAAQSLYGAPDATTSATAGNTTWGANTTLTDSYLKDVFAFLSGETASNSAPNIDTRRPMAFTIYDVNGVDTLDLRHNTTNDRIDLNAETFSDIAGGIGNLAIARDTLIENLVSGSGDDSLTGNDAHNLISAGKGEDVISAGRGADTVHGGAGHDSISGGRGADSLIGQSGNDTLFGNHSTDILRGDWGKDSLVGGTGADTIYGGVGNDTLFGNTALDWLYGDDGNDYISAGDGKDYVWGGDGDDTIHGRSGWDTLAGDTGNDVLYGSSGDDEMSGGAGNDWLSGGGAWDTLFGNEGHDTLYGNFGSDVLSGGVGKDALYGGSGDDSLRGGHGNDTLYGNQGVDHIDGGTGDDVLHGGTLSDTYVFAVGHGRDEITDFETTDDRLMLTAALVENLTEAQDIIDTFARVTANGVFFDFGEGDSLLISNLHNLSGLEDNILLV